MRIKQKIEKTGYFWLPFAPEKKIPGVLCISDGGNIDLEVVGLFDESIDGLNKALNGKATMDRIVGDVETYGLVTLDNCFYKKSNIPLAGISKSLVCVNRAFLGVAYDENEPVLFNQFTFALEGIDEWIGISGIKVSNDPKARSATITYKHPQDISIDLSKGMKLKITFSWVPPSLPANKEAKISQKTFLKLVSEKELPLDVFITSAYKIATLVCFAIDETVCFERVSATSDSLVRDMNSGKTIPIPVEIIYASLPFDEKEPKAGWHRMLFRFGQIKDDAERIINNWISAYETIDPALNLYFSVRTGTHKYLESKFLALAQCLETLHRRTSTEKMMNQAEYQKLVEEIVSHCPNDHKAWLSGKFIHGNEVNLGRRLKRIVEPFKDYIGSNKERTTLIRSIVDTRNYLTHYDDSNTENVVRGHDLWPLCLKMEAIFQLHLLETLGFTKEEVDAVHKNSPDLQRKLKLREY